MDVSEKEKWDKYGEGRLLARRRLLIQRHRLATRFFLDYFKNVDIDSKVLDVGCAEGFFLELLRDLGFENLRGIEPGNLRAQKAQGKGLHVEVKGIDEVNEQATCDVVMFMDVFEHLPQPENALRKIHEILAPGGIFYLNIPICDSLANLCYRLVTRRTRLDLVKGWDETHINAFSKHELKELLTNTGFEIIKAQRLANRFPFVGRLSQDLSDFLQQFTVFGLCGDFLTVIAQKK